MKIYISADIEGVTGVSTWKEADNQGSDAARVQMTKEVAAACEGLLKAGATEIVVKDAHGDGKNLYHEMLPKEVKLITGWSGHPFNMVEGLDDTFDGVVFIGYHSDGLSNGSTLAHTLSPNKIRGIWLNEQPASEYTLFSYCAKEIGVPILLVSGDAMLIHEVRQVSAHTATVAVKQGFGGAMIDTHPVVALERIEKAAMQGISQIEKHSLKGEESYTLKIAFVDHADAYKYSFFPGATQINEYVVSYTSTDYMDVLTFLNFL